MECLSRASGRSRNTCIILEPHYASDQLKSMASPKPEFIHMHTSDKRVAIRNCCLPHEIRAKVILDTIAKEQ